VDSFQYLSFATWGLAFNRSLLGHEPPKPLHDQHVVQQVMISLLICVMVLTRGQGAGERIPP